MTWDSLVGTFVDATVGQMVHALSGGPRPSPSPLEERPAPDDQDLRDGSLKLVRYTLASVRRCEERILPDGRGEVLVQGSTTAGGFAARIVADYLQPDEGSGRRIPAEDLRSLRVSWQVLARWPLKCKSGKRGALEGIRDALRGEAGARGSVTPARAWNGQDGP